MHAEIIFLERSALPNPLVFVSPEAYPLAAVDEWYAKSVTNARLVEDTQLSLKEIDRLYT